MRIVLQRVTKARVLVNENVTGEIDQGALVLIGAGQEDSEADATYLAEKTVNLRVFADEDGKMNKSLLDVGGGALAISQFTLFGDARRGRRPAFTSAMEPGEAKRLYEFYVSELSRLGVKNVQTGIFAADMKVELTNDGPVTILLDSKKAF